MMVDREHFEELVMEALPVRWAPCAANAREGAVQAV